MPSGYRLCYSEPCSAKPSRLSCAHVAGESIPCKHHVTAVPRDSEACRPAEFFVARLFVAGAGRLTALRSGAGLQFRRHSWTNPQCRRATAAAAGCCCCWPWRSWWRRRRCWWWWSMATDADVELVLRMPPDSCQVCWQSNPSQTKLKSLFKCTDYCPTCHTLERVLYL